MIEVQGLTKSYGGRTVLDDMSFRIDRGERVAFLGVNGAGKTTLLRCLLGLVTCEGVIRIGDLDARRHGVEVRSRLGYVPQRAPVSDLTAGEFVRLIAGLRGVGAGRVARTLEAFGLSLEREGEKPLRALSGGMLQKTLLALILADGVPILLLDEPTGNLDPAARREFLTALGRVDASTTVLLASHQISDVQAIADRILVLHDGGVAFDGSVRELQGHARAPGTLWLQVPPERRDAARRVLDELPQALDVHGNGPDLIRIRSLPRDRGSLLRALEGEGIEVQDLRTEEEPLEEVLARLARGEGTVAGERETGSAARPEGDPAGPGREP